MKKLDKYICRATAVWRDSIFVELFSLIIRYKELHLLAYASVSEAAPESVDT